MSQLYPSLDERFKNEGICRICLMEMSHLPRFTCDNDHVICQRCRAYFFNCPQCLQPLQEIPAHQHQPERHGDYMSHQPYPHLYPPPSAPNLEQFHEHERRYLQHPQQYEEPELLECPYSHLGCTAKFVEALRDMHVSRCQYKHHNEEHLTQVSDPEHNYCRYQSHGCNVRLPQWRLHEHEQICIYKDRESPSDCSLPNTDEERICCKYESSGCNVQLPHWRISQHEEICIYKDREPPNCNVKDDHTFCKYESVGCNVRLPHYRITQHEDICIYKDRESSAPLHCNEPNVHDDRVFCNYKSVGCNVRLPHWRMHEHEEICIYKDRESSANYEDGRVPCRYQSVGCHVRVPHSRLRSHEDICIYKDRSGYGSNSVEELGQHLQGSCYVRDDSHGRMGYRY